MRIHAGFGVMVIALARWLGFDAVRLAVVMLTVGAVIGAEWLNTAIERAVDLVTTRPHPLARLAKDLAAGAVLWFGLVAVVVGVLLFGPYLPDLPALIARSSPGRLAEVGAMLAVGLALVFTGIRRGAPVPGCQCEEMERCRAARRGIPPSWPWFCCWPPRWCWRPAAGPTSSNRNRRLPPSPRRIRGRRSPIPRSRGCRWRVPARPCIP